MRYFLIALAVLCMSCLDRGICDDNARQLYPGRKVEVIEASSEQIYVIDGKYAVRCSGTDSSDFVRLSWRPWKDSWCGHHWSGHENYQKWCVPPKTPEKAP